MICRSRHLMCYTDVRWVRSELPRLQIVYLRWGDDHSL